MSERIIYDEETDTLIVKEGVRVLSCYDFKDIKKAPTLIISSSVIYIGSVGGINNVIQKILFQDNSNLEVIGSHAFEFSSSLKDITLPNSCKIIGNNAFDNCTSLKSINLENVLYIGSQALAACSSLEEIKIPSSVEYMDYALFRGCVDLEKIYLPKSVKNRFDDIEKILTEGNSAEIILIEDNERTNISDISSNLEITETPKEIVTPPKNIIRYDGVIRPNILTKRKKQK